MKLIVSIFAAAMIIGCDSRSDSSKRGTGLTTRPTSNSQPTTQTWEWSAEDGDKPGTGLHFVASDDTIIGTFCIVDPSHPHDFRAAGRAYPLLNMFKANREISFGIRTTTDNDVPEKRMKLLLTRKLTGPVGDEISGQLTELGEESSTLNVVFIRRQ